MLRVAREGLLADLRGVFFVCFGWVKCFNSFHAVGTSTCLFMQDQHFREWDDFYTLALFFSVRSSLKIIWFFPLQQPVQSAEGITRDSSSQSPVGQTFICLLGSYYLDPTEMVGQSQLGWAREVDSKSEERFWKWAIPGRNMEMGCNCTEKRRAFVKKA